MKVKLPSKKKTWEGQVEETVAKVKKKSSSAATPSGPPSKSFPEGWQSVPVPPALDNGSGFNFSQQYLTITYRTAASFRDALREGDAVYWLNERNEVMSGILTHRAGPMVTVTDGQGGARVTLQIDRILRALR